MSDVSDQEGDVVVDEVFEKAEQEVMSFLPEMSEGELRQLMEELGVVVPEEKKGRRVLYRFAYAYLMQMEHDEADKGKAKYLQIHEYLREMLRRKRGGDGGRNDGDQTPAPILDTKQSVLNRTLPALPIGMDIQQRFVQEFHENNRNFPDPRPRQVSPQDGNLPGAPPNLYQRVNSSREHPTQVPYGPEFQPKPASLFQLKECKIRGSIGDPGERDKMNYDGLLSQITEKVGEGYTENRIVGAVINAITPGHVLKSRLEMRRNLEGAISLEVLKNMLRIHFQEQDSQNLMTQLKEAVQLTTDTASQFCNKLILIRDRALSRSIEEGVAIDKTYLRKRFLKSFQSGLRNGNIRNELRQLVKTEPDDDTLLEAIDEAARGEAERAGKLTAFKTADVSVINRERNDFQRDRNPLAQKMEEMELKHNREMVSMKAELSEIKNIFKAGFSNLASAGNSQNVSALSSTSASYPPQPPVYVQDLYNQSAVASQPMFTSLVPQQQQSLPQQSLPQQPSVLQQQQLSMPQQQIPPVAQPLSVSHQQQNQTYVPPPLRNQPPSLPSLMSINNNPSSLSSGRPRFTGCHNCVANNIRWCDHCLLCGAADHRVSTCPNRQAMRDRHSANNPSISVNNQPAPTAAANAPGNG